jgi:hypothetical protein
MAAVARPPVASGNSGLKAALIAFVCLTVASLGAFIYLFTLQSDYERDKTAAQTQANDANKSASQAKEQLSGFAKDTIGEATDSAAQIQKKIDELRNGLVQDENLKGKIRADMALASVLQQLKAEYDATLKQLQDVTAERKKLNDDFAALNEAAQATKKSVDEKLAQLETQYQNLEKESTDARGAWTKDLADLRTRLDSVKEATGKDLSTARQALASIEEQLKLRDTRIQELRETLASFRPTADQFAAIQIADGTIVRTLPGQNIAYISLGSRDRVKSGMSFSVYSRHKGVPADGKGKATLEVSQVFVDTSEARIRSTTPGEPVMVGDVIANPIFDRNRQLNFVVAGDFDLDFDGVAEDPGGKNVARMIESWGGKIVKTVDTRTDFVVLGAPPAAPPPATATETTTAAEHKAEYEARVKAFDAITAEVKALSIPVLTRTQFLHFMGVAVPKNVAEDQRSW